MARPGVRKMAGSAMAPVKNRTGNQTHAASLRKRIRDATASIAATTNIAADHAQLAAKPRPRTISANNPATFTRGSTFSAVRRARHLFGGRGVVRKPQEGWRWSAR